MTQIVKNLPAMQETQVGSLGWEDPLEKEWLSAPVFLPAEFHGERNLMGYTPWGHKDLDTTKQQQWYVLRALQVLLCTLIKKEYVKAEYCHPAYLTYMQSTS